VKEILGYLGTALLSLCAFPLVVATIKAGHADGIDPGFLALWFAGEVAMLAHVLPNGATRPIRINYFANAIMVGIIGWYKWF
jgi:hypothetical protein